MNWSKNNNNIRVFWALLRRDLKVLRSKLRSMLIDGAILVATNVLIFGKLFPLIGMPSHFVAPLFLGHSISMLLLSLGYSLGLKIVFDIQYNRFIDYHLTLPVSKTWLFLSYIVSFMIEAFIITIPLVTLGIVLLGDAFAAMTGNWFIFFGVFLLNLLFISTLFLSFSFYYDPDYFRDNLWGRRLIPLLLFSTTTLTWRTVANFLPRASKLFALNPFTHNTEALRAALLGGPEYLPLWFSVVGMIFWIGFNCWLLAQGIIKRVDPV